LFRC